MEHAVIWGLAASPVIGMLMFDRLVGDHLKIAAPLAWVFTLLFLVMVVGFLAAMALSGTGPYEAGAGLLDSWISRYLQVYAIWVAAVGVGLPVVFNFR